MINGPTIETYKDKLKLEHTQVKAQASILR